MTAMMKVLGAVSSSVESSTRAAEFYSLARTIVQRDVGELLDESRISPRVAGIVKAGVAAGSLGSADWSAVAEFDSLKVAFLESLRTSSVFDALLAAGMKRVPLRTQVVTSSSAIIGATPSELSIKPISALTLSSADVDVKKAAAIIVASTELFKLVLPGASGLFESELRAGVVAATDMQFLSALYASVTPTASAGATTANILADIAALLAALTLGANSRVFFIISPAAVKKLILKTTTGGDLAFPNLQLTGGKLVAEIPVIVSDQLPAGALLAVDASGLAGNSAELTLRKISQGDVQLDSSPDSPPTASTTLRSLWQHNEKALVIERFFGFGIVRTGAVAVLSGVAY